MKHRWTIDVAVPLERDDAQHLWCYGNVKVRVEVRQGTRRVYCSRCWARLDHTNLDAECVTRRDAE